MEAVEQVLQALRRELDETRQVVERQNAQIQTLQTPPPPPRGPATNACPFEVVDTHILTKPSVFTGEIDNKEKFNTRAFRMQTYCAALAPRLGELIQRLPRWQQVQTRLTRRI